MIKSYTLVTHSDYSDNRKRHAYNLSLDRSAFLTRLHSDAVQYASALEARREDSLILQNRGAVLTRPQFEITARVYLENW